MKRLWTLIPLMLFFGLILVMRSGLSRDPRALPSERIGKLLPHLTLPLLDDPSTRLHLADVKGRMTLLNVWASWCGACREEQIFLLNLAKQGVPIIGLNYQDDRNTALAWLQQWGNPFRQTISDVNGRAGIELGVYGAPETFLIDEEGVIRYRFAGILNQTIWRDVFLPLMCKQTQAQYCIGLRVVSEKSGI